MTSGKQKEGSLGRYCNFVPRVLSPCFEKEPGLRLVTWPESGSRMKGRGRLVNNYRYDKSYSVKAREKIAVSFIIS